MHFIRTHTDAEWVAGYVLQPDDFRDPVRGLDAKLFKAINGDDGGAWAPSAPIVIAGSGLQVTGPCLVSGAGRVQTVAGSGARVVLGDGDWPLLAPGHAGQSRVLLNSCELCFSAEDVRTFARGFQTGYPGQVVLVPLTRVHHGAMLVQAVFTFSVGSPHTAPPEVLPRMKVVAVDAKGTLLPLKSTSSGADKDGHLSPTTPADGTSWYANGAPQTLTYMCDQNVAIDVGAFTYAAEIIDESGANAFRSPSGPNFFGNIFHSVELTFANILDLRFA